ncbi:MAG TPA: bifunctional helix-turn-helix transcriptional regulator/GNAT family N-acetyltransferase, partial [Janthinobacterium sp.]|nr:bifunctional helix-turn-helix transcriptional regulator/GNAT family N-acetyltransferase [Janthinobacterium sp.]
VARLRSENDGRAKLLQLTEAGRAVFDPLDRRSRDEVAELLARLGDAGQQSMLAAMRTIQELLDERPGMKYAQPFFLRPHRPGDMGWIAYRHGFIYAEENGWDNSFEALVAQICADFIQRFDPQQEQCWIAEMNGERAGSIALARADEEGVAKLRLLLVEPKARGHGLGARLVDECLAFARAKGYRKIQLWTTSSQTEARQLYRKVGFALTAHEAAHSFGHDLVNETWELLL